MSKFKKELTAILLDVKHSADHKEMVNDFIYNLSGGEVVLNNQPPPESVFLKLDLNYNSMKVFVKSLIKQRFGNIDRGIMEIERILLSKNLQYGNAILEPNKIFSKNVFIEDIILSRMDEKLNRIINIGEGDSEDAWLDLIGYSIFYLINKKYYIY